MKRLFLFVAAAVAMLSVASCGTKTEVEPDPAIMALHAVPEDLQFWTVGVPMEASDIFGDRASYGEGYSGRSMFVKVADTAELFQNYRESGQDRARLAVKLHSQREEEGLCEVVFLSGAEPQLDGSHIAQSKTFFDKNVGYTVDFVLDKFGTARFAEVTRDHLGQPLAIVLKDRVLSLPTIMGEITGGRVSVSVFSEAEAEAVSCVFKNL